MPRPGDARGTTPTWMQQERDRDRDTRSRELTTRHPRADHPPDSSERAAVSSNAVPLVDGHLDQRTSRCLDAIWRRAWPRFRCSSATRRAGERLAARAAARWSRPWCWRRGREDSSLATSARVRTSARRSIRTRRATRLRLRVALQSGRASFRRTAAAPVRPEAGVRSHFGQERRRPHPSFGGFPPRGRPGSPL